MPDMPPELLFLSPRSAGSSDFSLRVAKHILSLDGLTPVRKVMNQGNNLRTFCGFVAREIDKELQEYDYQIMLQGLHDFTFTPGEQGRLDAQDALFRGRCQQVEKIEVTRNHI